MGRAFPIAKAKERGVRIDVLNDKATDELALSSVPRRYIMIILNLKGPMQRIVEDGNISASSNA